MPIILEHTSSPNEQDWQDLERIFQSVPEYADLSREQLEHQLNDDCWIITGRFNDRVVGSILAKTQPNKSLGLSIACVLAMTQQRGVMHQMMALLLKWADNQKLALSCERVPVHLCQTLITRGFEQQADGSWLRENKPDGN